VSHIPQLYLAAGCAALLAALLPLVLRRLPLSMPIVFLTLGVVAFTLIRDLPSPDPIRYRLPTEHLAEVTVIVALFGAGLALDRPVGWRRWASTWRLLAIAMPVTIAAVTAAAGLLTGVGLAAALLLGSALAPTDPVLASDVQVGEPTDSADSEDEPRFALTSEAGLNDALAFPFVAAALALAAGSAGGPLWHRLAEWAAVDVAWRLSAGVAAGLAVGWLLGRLFFRPWRRGVRLAERTEGFVALACTFVAYGLTELVHGYGFVAVFVCACSVRAAERDHGYHGEMHGFIEQVERLLTAAVLVLLGGAMARGLFHALRPVDVALTALLLLVIRPVVGRLSLIGGPGGRVDRSVIAFFGVRGIGSVYYLAYAFGHAAFPPATQQRLWAVTGLVVLVSVVLHGVTATPVMARIDARRRRAAAAVGRQDEAQQVPV